MIKSVARFPTVEPGLIGRDFRRIAVK